VDLSPGYRELDPPDALRGIVACFWVRVAEDGDGVWIVPDGCTDLVWQLGRGTSVAGPDTTAKHVARAPGDLLVGMRLLPGAGGGVLGVPLDALRDTRADVADVNRAFDVRGDRAPDEVIERFAAVAADRLADPLVATAAQRLAEQEVRDVADDLGISERQLRRRFHAAAGYGPKTLARVLRFRRFVDGIDAGRTDLSRLALDAGYADQAHLTRETTRITGAPPQAFMRARRGVP
jgi:AraC-like DNA-binding protein